VTDVRVFTIVIFGYTSRSKIFALYDLAIASLQNVSFIIQKRNLFVNKLKIVKKIFCFYFVSTNLQVYAVNKFPTLRS